MTVGFGNSKKQAERNASIQGCWWVEKQPKNYLTPEEYEVDQEVISSDEEEL
jgi:hypothetical protein